MKSLNQRTSDCSLLSTMKPRCGAPTHLSKVNLLFYFFMTPVNMCDERPLSALWIESCWMICQIDHVIVLWLIIIWQLCDVWSACILLFSVSAAIKWTLSDLYDDCSSNTHLQFMPSNDTLVYWPVFIYRSFQQQESINSHIHLIHLNVCMCGS